MLARYELITHINFPRLFIVQVLCALPALKNAFRYA